MYKRVRNWIEDVIPSVLLIIIGVGVIGGIYITIAEESARLDCIEAGYPVTQYSIIYGGICYREENGNTVSVPTDSLPHNLDTADPFR